MPTRTRHALSALTIAVALVLITVSAALAAAVIHFTHESYQRFQSQLGSGQVKAVTFNKKAHTVHVTLTDGRHVLASYPPKNYATLASQLQSKGLAVKVEKKKAKPVHHKLRYIAAGVLVVLIVIVVVVLALNRRRPPAAASGGSPAGAGAPPPDAPPVR